MHLQCEPENQTERVCPCNTALFGTEHDVDTLREFSAVVPSKSRLPLFSKENLKLHLGPGLNS